MTLLRHGRPVGVISPLAKRGYAVLVLGVGGGNWDYPLNEVVEMMKRYVEGSESK